jgi:hypothetical protein
MRVRIPVMVALALGASLELGAAWFRQVPLTDMRAGRYKTFAGGLYPRSNVMPPDHAARGAVHAAAIVPRNLAGQPDGAGRYVLLSIGMSNTTQEFCSQSSGLPCTSWSFMGGALGDPAVNHSTLAIVNGAAGGQSAATWDSPTDPNYDRVRDTRLMPQGLSEAQVQIAWVKVANPGPTASLPAQSSDAYTLETQMGNIVRALKVRYPNLRQVFLSSRIFAGYANTSLNPEPYAYESGFAVKWIVQAQIDQMANGGVPVDPRAGDLNYGTVAPWIAWGPYLWAAGVRPRSDGLTWRPEEFDPDGTHPGPTAEKKVGALLLEFFKTSPMTACWFAGGGCN